MGIPWEWERKYANNGNVKGKSTRDGGNGNGYFFMCAKNSHQSLNTNASH